jgi:DNA-binding Xre family transcriptional regulator
MAFRYDNLWNILADRDMSKEELRNKIGASQTTIVKMGRNENVSLDVIDKICSALHCTPDDFLVYINPYNNHQIKELQRKQEAINEAIKKILKS